jgi:hypothetical protein
MAQFIKGNESLTKRTEQDPSKTLRGIFMKEISPRIKLTDMANSDPLTDLDTRDFEKMMYTMAVEKNSCRITL